MDRTERAEIFHGASLRLLEDPGVKIEHDDIRRLLLENGAREGAGRDVIRFPSEMVAEYLELCPSRIVLSARGGVENTLEPGCGSVVWSTPGLKLADGGTARLFTSSDMAAFSRLIDKLENVDGVFGAAMDDIKPAARDFTGLRIMAANTRKHIRVFSFSPKGCEAMLEMKKVVGGGAWFSMGFTAHGPLRWTNLALEIFKRSAGHGIPVTVNGEPMAGVSGPVTLAGSVAVGNAEILSGIIINQILEPGRPCIYNLGLAHVMDMRTAIAVTGGPENALLAEASAVLGEYYKIPSCSWVSTESMTEDAQAALEKMFGFKSHMDAGVSLIWGAGQLESEMALSFSQAVIDDEMLGYIRRHRRGFCADKNALAEDVTRAIGPCGSFLQEEHTLENFRAEIFEPEILWRKSRLSWEKEGCPELRERARERAAGLIAMERGVPLCPDVEKALLDIEKRYMEIV